LISALETKGIERESAKSRCCLDFSTWHACRGELIFPRNLFLVVIPARWRSRGPRKHCVRETKRPPQ
jgi:hypothetical protein